MTTEVTDVALTLFAFPGSCSLTSMIALEEAGLDYDVIVPNMLVGEHLQDGYLSINPKGKIPTLLVNNQPLTETVAILTYIADLRGTRRMLPPTDAPLARALVVSRLAWLASSTLAAFNRLILPHNACSDEAAEQSVREAALTAIARDLRVLENELATDGYWFTEFTVADIFSFFIHQVATQFSVDLDDFPRFGGLTSRLAGRPAFQRAMTWTREFASNV